MRPRLDERGNSRRWNSLIVKELEPTPRAVPPLATNCASSFDILHRKPNDSQALSHGSKPSSA